MSAVIKSGNFAGISAVRPLPPVAPPPKLDEERDRLRSRITALESELRQHQTSIAELHTEVAASFERGKAHGYQSGLDAAERHEAEKLALLEGAIGRALGECASSLSSLERLSALLARDALELILGDAEYRRELLEKIIAKQVATVEKSLLVGIALSREDFPDEDSLSALAQGAATSRAMLTASADMAPGGCVMTLRLGRLDIGIAQQWGAVREMLTQLSSPEAPS